MTVDASQDTAGEATSAGVETDLPCAKCGYNLRTLAWSSRCPECGTPVLESAPPVGFRFHSQRSAARAQIGIAFLGAAMLAGTLGTILFTAATRLIFVIPKPCYWFGLYTWVYLPYVGGLLYLGAILFITQPLVDKCDRFKARLGAVAVLFATVALLGAVSEGAVSLGGAGVPALSRVASLPFLVASLCWPVAISLSWLHLLLRVDRAHQRKLWLLMCLGAATPVLVFCADLLSVISYLAGPPELRPLKWVIAAHESWGWTHLWIVAWWWQKYIVRACGIVMLLVLLFFLRQLRGARRGTLQSAHQPR